MWSPSLSVRPLRLLFLALSKCPMQPDMVSAFRLFSGSSQPKAVVITPKRAPVYTFVLRSVFSPHHL